MRILTLIENTSATEKLYAEHGLSLYIEHNGGRYLIDTGADDKFAENAKRMQVDLYGLDAAVLSHNHIDHAGGLDKLFDIDPLVQVYAKAAVVGEYTKKVGIAQIPIGKSKTFFEKHSANFVLFSSFQQIAEGFFLLSNEVDDSDMTCRDGTLYRKLNGKRVRDNFNHELFAVIFPTLKKEDGCVIISSCSHNGIVNIVKTVKETWKYSPVLAVVGGFHIMGSSTKKMNCTTEFVKENAEQLINLDVGMIYTCHCTGIRGYECLKEYLGDRVQYLQTGEELEF